MLPPAKLPGFFVTGTDTGVGKTLITAAIADYFDRHDVSVAAMKPIATGCRHDREGLVSADAEFIASASRSIFLLDEISPVRYAQPLAPAVASAMSERPIDWLLIEQTMSRLQAMTKAIVVEGVGGVMVPLEENHTVLDLMKWLQLPVVLVTHANLGTINHTLLSIAALRAYRLPIAGIVVNRYPTRGALEVVHESNVTMIEQWSGVPVLAIVPEVESIAQNIPADVAGAIDTCNWASILASSKRLN